MCYFELCYLLHRVTRQISTQALQNENEFASNFLLGLRTGLSSVPSSYMNYFDKSQPIFRQTVKD